MSNLNSLHKVCALTREAKLRKIVSSFFIQIWGFKDFLKIYSIFWIVVTGQTFEGILKTNFNILKNWKKKTFARY